MSSGTDVMTQNRGQELMPVANVTTRQGEDITDLLNAAGNQYGFDPVALLGLLIAESGLDSTAAHEGVWPDVSYGLSQQTVAWAEIPGLARAGDGTALDTPQNRQLARDFFFNAGQAIGYTVPRFANLWRQAGGDALLACCLWNWPNLDGWTNPDPQHAANKAAYASALQQAEAYRVTDQLPLPEPAPLQSETVATVAADDGLNLRGGPRLTAGVVTLLPPGRRVYVGSNSVNQDGYDWRQVAALVNGRLTVGWCAEAFLRGL